MRMICCAHSYFIVIDRYSAVKMTSRFEIPSTVALIVVM